jgi:hypothetical protein
MRRWPQPPPPESNAYLILGIASTLLGIAAIYGSISEYVHEHPGVHHHPTFFGGIVWLIIGLAFLVPAIRRKIRK